MTPLLRPVTKMKCSMPAALASSTTCWITGRSTTVSISLGTALVAGRNRVPSPATGKTALRTRLFWLGMVTISASSYLGARLRQAINRAYASAVVENAGWLRSLQLHCSTTDNARANKDNDMSVLVTGGAGYIGSHMALELLDAGEPVVVLDNLSTGLAWAVPEGRHLRRRRRRRPEPPGRACLESQGVDAIIHFAGSIVVPEFGCRSARLLPEQYGQVAGADGDGGEVRRPPLHLLLDRRRLRHDRRRSRSPRTRRSRPCRPTARPSA